MGRRGDEQEAWHSDLIEVTAENCEMIENKEPELPKVNSQSIIKTLKTINKKKSKYVSVVRIPSEQRSGTFQNDER